MSDRASGIRGYKLVFTSLGLLYIAMASSMLVRGVGALREFGVPESVTLAPVLEDIFLFFYQYMAVVGGLTVLFGHVARTRGTQTLVSVVFCVLNLLGAARDLSTSDSSFGNHLYRGEKTMVFVYIGLALAGAFGWLAAAGLRKPAITSRTARVDAGKTHRRGEYTSD